MDDELPERGLWLEILMEVDPNAREAATAFLFDLGCEGVVSEDFEEKTLKGYLPPGIDPEEAEARILLFLDRLKEIFPEARILEPVLRKMEEEDWDSKWRRFFRPERITPHLLVLPAWEPFPENVSGQVLRIDPGPAFGTGRHPTTRMCLKAMEEIVFGQPWTMLDVGTGSGILAVYGAMLGARRVLALDSDPEAVRWAGENVHLNGFSEVVEISGRPLQSVTERFSLVAANLTLNAILDLLPCLHARLKAGGRLILSGLLREQMEETKEGLSAEGLRREREYRDGEWGCLLVKG